MRSISKSKHEHLQGSMEELERLLAGQDYPDAMEIGMELIDKKEQLQQLFCRYELLLKQLEYITRSYTELSVSIKSDLLSKHLKELQKTVKPDHPDYRHLFLSVQLLYGT